MIARLRALDPLRADLVLAGAFLAEAIVELVALVPARTEHHAAAAALLLALAAALAARRRTPLAAAVIGWAVLMLVNALPRAYVDNMVSPFFAVLLLAYSSGRHLEDRRAAVALVAGVALSLAASAIDRYDDTVAEVLSTIGFTAVAPLLIGRYMRHRAGLHATLREKTARLARERQERAAAAAAEERTRIAGELHDVVAHALSAMVVQGAAARRLATADPQRAATAFTAVEDTGRAALTEIRSMLGVLRREDEELALAPQPSLRHLASLIARTRAAGLPVELSVEGDERDLPAGVDLTAYRVVQEALRGALEQGGAGRAGVRLRYGPEYVVVRVDDDGLTAPRALPGVRERVVLYGGQLRAGARRDGGHGVRARLPIGGAA